MSTTVYEAQEEKQYSKNQSQIDPRISQARNSSSRNCVFFGDKSHFSAKCSHSNGLEKRLIQPEQRGQSGRCWDEDNVD